MIVVSRARRTVERARLVDGEAPPAAGDVLVLGLTVAVRVKRVRDRDVWYVGVNVDRGPLGGERWEFLPPASRWGPERLKRRMSND